MTERGALRRVLGPGTLALIFANGTIGAGIFAVPGLVAAALGSATALGYAICAVLVMLIFLCFAEVGSRVHESGGAYAYVETAFGPFAGFIAANLMWFGFAACSDAASSSQSKLSTPPECGGAPQHCPASAAFTWPPTSWAAIWTNRISGRSSPAVKN